MVFCSMDQIKIIDDSCRLHSVLYRLPQTLSWSNVWSLPTPISATAPTTRTPGRRCKIFSSMNSPSKLPQISKQQSSEALAHNVPNTLLNFTTHHNDAPRYTFQLQLGPENLIAIPSHSMLLLSYLSRILSINIHVCCDRLEQASCQRSCVKVMEGLINNKAVKQAQNRDELHQNLLSRKRMPRGGDKHIEG
ncbi:hypothetical protein BGZ65_012989 [Modicella reniformis]|uniref:Uncharacterized protein n=1 Tax=Modicella reniformis TaxID=1440133 RepID=A0A9P6JFJ3_9FUNG|nr:hypothetical protein BGZ65_012989 [Modicella reniformis]